MQVWYVGPICKTIIITLTCTAPTPGLHFFVTKPHFSPNRNIWPNYSTMLLIAIKYRHDDHNRLSSSGNLFFDVWHNLPFKKEGLLCCFLEWKCLWARQVGSPTPFIMLEARHRRFVVVDPLGLTMFEKCMKKKFTSWERLFSFWISFHERRTCRMI